MLSKLSYLVTGTACVWFVKNLVMAEKDIEELFPMPLFKNGRYDMPWETEGVSTRPCATRVAWEFYKQGEPDKVPSKKRLDQIEEMKILPLDQEKLCNPEGIQVTWLGHAGFLVQLNGVNILFDPILSDRCSPFSFAGPKRFRKAPCTIDELPQIDIVCISHDHYDHLDRVTVEQLDQVSNASIRWCVPLGMKEWLVQTVKKSQKNIFEFNWWEEITITKKLNMETDETTINNSNSSVVVAFVPAQHWCKRNLSDNTRLWGGWVIKDILQKVYHAGDTGYCDVFKSIGKRYGPIDLALIPIGAYCPRLALKWQHVDPGEAVKVHMDVKSKKSIAMHWGTFELAKEHYLEPPRLLKEELTKQNIPLENFAIMKHGETLNISSHNDEK